MYSLDTLVWIKSECFVQRAEFVLHKLAVYIDYSCEHRCPYCAKSSWRVWNNDRNSRACFNKCFLEAQRKKGKTVLTDTGFNAGLEVVGEW